MPEPLPVLSEVCLEPQKLCPCPLYLRWTNDTAGERWWVFDGTFTETTPTRPLADFTPYEAFLALREEGRALLGKTGEARFQANARDVSISFYEWLRSLKLSPLVYLLVDNTPGAYKWQAVIIQDLIMPRECEDAFFDARIVFTVPEFNTVKRT